MQHPPTCIQPYTEHQPTCPTYNEDMKLQSAHAYSQFNTGAHPSETVSMSAAFDNIDDRVRHSITLMEDHLHRDLNISDIAHHVNLSLWHLCHLFKSETGMPPARYLKILRLKKAKELLETTFLNVKEIKIRVGIHDESHFARSFKQAFGIAPAQYRTRYLSDRKLENRLINGITETASN